MTASAERLLDGQRAIVTGASSGIGAAVARALAAAGARVIVNFIGGEERAGQVVGDIAAAGGKALAVRADVSREDQVRSLFAAAVDAWGGLDILVGNAGVQRDAALVDMTLADWDTVIGVNLTGQFLCAREAARLFLKQGARPEVSTAAGKIICISSVHDVIPWAGHVNYAASKGGLNMMMKSVAQELAFHRVRVNAISPGAIKTAINRAAWETPEAMARLLALAPYGRLGEPDDIGKAAVWLASDESDYVTGATLYVDGGMTLYPGFIDNG
ncbi:glucose 1-dehydrogenase [Shumkonia mesophila]|uniref:glucose 1-dehydrogenase n=1 Tax=Shumkonia mesophila TaxID=2838854 RepID=UPI00293432DB|nr:glucose 1-dehydrogenase [Shumkonia mesophila]